MTCMGCSLTWENTSVIPFTLAGFSGNNTLVLRKNYYGYTTLCETDFEWKMDEEYKISLLVS